MNCFCVFVKHQLPIFVWVLGSLLCLIDLNISPMPIPDSIDYSSYIVSLEIGGLNSLTLFFSKIVCYLTLPFQVKFESTVLLASYYLSYLFHVFALFYLVIYLLLFFFLEYFLLLYHLSPLAWKLYVFLLLFQCLP